MNTKIALLLAILLPASAFAAPTYSMHIPTKGLTISATAGNPSSSGGTAAPAVPAAPNPSVPTLNAQGEISYGGLTLAKVGNVRMNYASALAACAGTLNGKTGWRLVTQSEWSTVRVGAGAGMFEAAGYDMSSIGWVWHADSFRTGRLVSRPSDNGGSWADEPDPWWTVCVRAS